MSYESCAKHDCDATNGCVECDREKWEAYQARLHATADVQAAIAVVLDLIDNCNSDDGFDAPATLAKARKLLIETQDAAAYEAGEAAMQERIARDAESYAMYDSQARVVAQHVRDIKKEICTCGHRRCARRGT
jgi:hypothetical protein